MRPRYYLLPLWIVACLLPLYFGLTAPAPVDIKDIHVGMSFWMLILSFPIGLLVFVGSDLATIPFGAYFGVAWEHHPEFYCFIWSCYFIIGLLQWLVVIPWLIQKIKSQSTTKSLPK
jgi:hypothetical protein